MHPLFSGDILTLAKEADINMTDDMFTIFFKSAKSSLIFIYLMLMRSRANYILLQKTEYICHLQLSYEQSFLKLKKKDSD